MRVTQEQYAECTNVLFLLHRLCSVSFLANACGSEVLGTSLTGVLKTKLCENVFHYTDSQAKYAAHIIFVSSRPDIYIPNALAYKYVSWCKNILYGLKPQNPS
jgi:hypothetical protein